MNEGMKNLMEIEKWKKRAQEAEGELTIIKGIGNTSPEMKALKTQVENLKKEIDLIRDDAQVNMLEKEKHINGLLKINKEHQKTNGELQVRLSQYEDKAAHYRRKAVL